MSWIWRIWIQSRSAEVRPKCSVKKPLQNYLCMHPLRWQSAPLTTGIECRLQKEQLMPHKLWTKSLLHKSWTVGHVSETIKAWLSFRREIKRFFPHLLMASSISSCCLNTSRKNEGLALLQRIQRQKEFFLLPPLPPPPSLQKLQCKLI